MNKHTIINKSLTLQILNQVIRKYSNCQVAKLTLSIISIITKTLLEKGGSGSESRMDTSPLCIINNIRSAFLKIKKNIKYFTTNCDS